jgi:hypothetical protein
MASFSTRACEPVDSAEPLCHDVSSTDVSESSRTRWKHRRKGQIAAVPVPGPPLRLSDRIAMLEKMLLLYEYSKAGMGKIPWRQRS